VASTIELRLDAVDQLFSSLDPFPFRNRDLDKDAEEFIVDWARELKDKAPPGIVIHLPDDALAGVDAGEIQDAIRRYFLYRAELIGSDLKQLFRVGRRALLIGLLMLGFCLTLGRLLQIGSAPTDITRFLQEGLVILGWVANWKPLEIFLYDWWPLAERRALYRRLGGADIRLKPAG
jgi:hypothetical protein